MSEPVNGAPNQPNGQPSHPPNGAGILLPGGHHRLPGAGPQKASGITPQFVLKALLQWWLVAVPVGLVLAVGAAAAVYFTYEPTYRAERLLQVNNDPFVDSREQLPSIDELIATQRELMRTKLVLGPVLEKIAHFEAIREAEDPSAFLAEQLQVVALSNTGLFKVIYEGKNPQQAAQIVNLVVESYINFQSELEQKQAHELMGKLKVEQDSLHAQVMTYGEQVQDREREKLEEDPLGQRSGGSPDTFNRLPLINLMEKQAEIGDKIALTKAKIGTLEGALESGAVQVSAQEVEAAVSSLPEVAQKEQEIQAHEAQVHDIEAKTPNPEKNALYLRLKSLKAKLESELATVKEEHRKKVREELTRLKLLSIQDQISAGKVQLENYQHSSEFYQKRFDEQLAALKTSEGPAFDLEVARWNWERAKATYAKVSDRLSFLQMRQNAPATIKSLETATPPKIPIERIPYKNLLLAASAAFCLPFGLAVLWEYRVRRVSDSQQLEQHSALTVVGEVASFPVQARGAQRSRRAVRGMRLFEESIDSLRTYLVLARPMRDVQVLAVTSASTREGKTSIASQLAVSIARATGETTLLIDGDMRKPDVHDIFGLELNPGLAQVLAGETPFEQAVDTTWSDRVHILPAGELTTNPHRLLGNGALKSLLNEARGRYRHVVIDTPPVLSASESLMLAAAADASLLCVMRNFSRVEQVSRTCQRLNEAGANVVGSVLSGVPVKQYAKYYGDYSYARS